MAAPRPLRTRDLLPSATMWIGGAITDAQIATVCALIDADYAGLDWGMCAPDPAELRWRLDHQDGPLRVSSEEPYDGGFPGLERYCRQQRLPYARITEPLDRAGDGEPYEPGALVYWLPGHIDCALVTDDPYGELAALQAALPVGEVLVPPLCVRGNR